MPKGRTVEDLRELMFTQMERLRDAEDPSAEIERSKALADMAQVVINSAKVEVDYLRANDGGSSNFLDSDVDTDGVPAIPGRRVHRIK